MKTKKERVKEIEKSSEKKISKSKEVYINTGTSMLNLACSDCANKGFLMGTMVNIIGDSSAGKTFLALTILAEFVHNSDFDDYELVYDDAEHRNSFNVSKLFGKKFNSRVVPAFGYDDDNQPINSETLEDFQDSIYDRLDSGKKCVYILDSMDSLDSEDDIDKYEDQMKSRQKKRKGLKSATVAGSYGMKKAKSNSETLRRICGKISKTNSLLIIISQTRQNIGIGFAEKTRSGGTALKFYASLEIWLAVVEKIKKLKMQIGVYTRARIKKNSITGKIRDVDFPIYYDYGVDDVKSCIDYLISTGVFVKPKGKSVINAEPLGVEFTIEKLIRYIEENNLENKLKKICQDTWLDVEDSLKTNRKKRYE